MKCFECKCDMINGITNHFVDMNNCILIIKNVPCLECPQCGEKYYTDDVAERLDEIVEAASKISTEIAVIDYTNKVA